MMLAPALLVVGLFITFLPLAYFNEFYETLPFLSRRMVFLLYRFQSVSPTPSFLLK